MTAPAARPTDGPSLAGRRDLGVPLLLAVVAITVAYAGWTVAGEWSGQTRSLIARLAMVPVTGLVSLMARRLAVHPHLDAGTRRAWHCVGVALVCLGTGYLLSYYYQHIRPTIEVSVVADVAYLLCYPTLLRGLLSFPHARRSRAERLTLALDAAVVVVGGGVLVWFFALQPAILQSPLGSWRAVVTVAYPIGDLILLLGISTLWLQRGAGHDRVLRLLAVGLLVNFVGDLAFAYQTQAGTYFAGSLLDVVWMTAYCLIGASALVQYRTAEAVGDAAACPVVLRPFSLSVLPAAAVGLSYTLLLLVALDQGRQPLLGLVIGAVVLTALVLARQVAAVRDNLRLQAETSARASEARFRALVQHASDVIAIVDPDSTVRFVSPSVERVLGDAPATVVGTPLLARVHPEDAPAAAAFFAEVAAAPGATQTGAWRLRHRDGTWLSVENSGTNLLDEPTVRGLVLNTRDVTERWALEEQLMHQAFHDPLTRLANRALFLDRVSHALHRAPRRQYSVAVLFLDLDNFKTVNDSLGHAEGDRLLVEAAARLQRCVRTGDTIARLGGDEFAVLVEDGETLPDIVQVAERVTHALAVPFVLDGKEVFVSASIGIARATGEETTDELLRNADVAMYIAKTRGKGRYELFEPHMHTAALERLELEADLRRALERQEFTLWYQPIVALADGRITGVEALLRWHHPVRGAVAPGTFVAIAEETGLIVPLGRWVLREACRQARRWDSAGADGAPLSVTVNVSGRHLQDPSLIDDVETALAMSGLDPRRLVLEITESMLMEHGEVTLQKLQRLRGYGIGLAIDDFGTGYSSLSRLQRFPVDILKIDKSFVDVVDGGQDEPVLARAIIALGDTLALRTVAEGIERPEQAAALLRLGCGLGQGYWYAAPMPAGEVAAVLGVGK